MSAESQYEGNKKSNRSIDNEDIINVIDSIRSNEAIKPDKFLFLVKYKQAENIIIKTLEYPCEFHTVCYIPSYSIHFCRNNNHVTIPKINRCSI